MKKIAGIWRSFVTLLNEKKFVGIALDDLLVKSLLMISLIIVIAMMLPSERPFEYSNLTVGSISRDEIIAPFTFPVLKSPATLEAEREQARLSVPPVFTSRENPADIQGIKLKNLFNELSQFFEQVSAGSEKNTPLTREGSEARVDSLIQQIFLKYNISLTADNLNLLYKMYREKRLTRFYNSLSAAFSRIYKKGIINIPKEQISQSEITVMNNGVDEEQELKQVLSLAEARKQVIDDLSGDYEGGSPELQLTPVFVTAFLSPDLIFDREVTEQRREKAVHEVPPTRGFVTKNQRIVDSHEVITEDIYRQLQSLADALKERSANQGQWYQGLFHLGKYLFALIILLLFGFYLRYYRPGTFRDNKMLLMITVILLMQFLFTLLIDKALQWYYLTIPIILGPMLLSMLLDASLAFVGTIIISLVLGASLGNSYYFTLLTFIVGTVALFSVQKIRNRGQMFRAILYIMLAYAAVNLSYGFIHFEPFGTIVENFAFYQLPNAILAPTAVFLLIGIFEKFFDVTTDITLLELSDLNHPLLKRLSVEAPGTFHHSIIVGNLAEAAAKAIGANSLLARVGCYYHDIGKMQRAEYFVENQSGAENKHEKLTPTMSSLILSKHVKAGLTLADEYGLPQAVKKFIPEHHGTNLMAYFYHKAKETMEEKDINEDDFRYPGPKPQSKETGIAMLADAVEAAARTLSNPNMQRISALVENLMEKRFQENELDECELTLRDLTKIKDAFVPILMGIHHGRVEYPKDEEKGEKGKAAAHGKSEEGKKGDKLSGKNAESSKDGKDKLKPVPAGNSNGGETNGGK